MPGKAVAVMRVWPGRVGMPVILTLEPAWKVTVPVEEVVDPGVKPREAPGPTVTGDVRLPPTKARAPALMKGFRGIPLSYSSCTSELKGLPEGSRPTRFQRASPSRASTSARVKAFETLCTEKGSCQSPLPSSR